jgi:hypothetical protein
MELGMTRAIFLMAAAILSSSLALADAPAPPLAAKADARTPAGASEDAVSVKLAMGPTSAPHLPGGTGGSSGSTSNCSPSTCPTSHKKIKQKHPS